MVFIGCIYICLFMFNNTVFSATQLRLTVMNQHVPEIAPSEDLIEDKEAMVKLKEIVDIYKKNKTIRMQKGEIGWFQQKDLEILKTFIIENNNTESSLTAKLIIAKLLFQDANVTDFELSKEIFRQISDKYPQRWQGKIAEISLLVAKNFEIDPKYQNLEFLTSMRTKTETMIEISQLLDNSTRYDIQAYCSLDAFPQVFNILSSMALYSERLGEYDVARAYYEKIINLYPNSTMAMKAKNGLNRLQKNLHIRKKKLNSKSKDIASTDSNNVRTSARAGAIDPVVTATEKQKMFEGEQDATLYNEETKSHSKDSIYTNLIPISGVLVFVVLLLMLLGLLRYKNKNTS